MALRLVSLGVFSIGLCAGAATAEQTLLPSGPGALQAFGRSIDAAGDVAIIGAPDAGVSGQAYVYRIDGGIWVEEDVLAPSDGVAGDGFGRNVAIRGDVAAVGLDSSNASIDPVYVFRRDGSAWVQEQKLLASDGAPGDFFGHDLAVGEDQILVGAHGAGASGRVYAFSADGTSWSESQVITPVSGTGFFGHDLAIDPSDPDRLLVGASGGTTVPESYVFDGTSWVFEASFTGFDGYSLAQRVDLRDGAAVFNALSPSASWGACIHRHDGSAWQPEQCFSPQGASNGVGQGGVVLEGDLVLLGWSHGEQALVYERDAVGTWELTRRFESPLPPLDTSNYGVSVAIAASRALVASTSTGPGTVWAVDLAFDGAVVLPDAPVALEFLGSSLACDGARMIAGARNSSAMLPSAGSAVIFVRGPTGFEEEQRLFASDLEETDRFGASVDIDGPLAMVGAYLEDTGASSAGAAYAYRFDGASWGSEQKLQLAPPGAGDQFGNAVALDAGRAAVGAHADDPVETNAGSVTVYRDDGSSLVIEQTLVASDPTLNAFFGTGVDLHGDVLIAGAPGPSGAGGTVTGAAYVFRRGGVIWAEEQKLAPNDLSAGDRFGEAVAAAAGVVAIGAPQHANGGTYRGAVYVYRHDGSSWIAAPKLVASDAMDGDRFGTAVAVDGDDLLVGMLRGVQGIDDPPESSPVVRYRWNGSAYEEVGRYEHPDGTNRGFPSDGFGWTLALAGGDVCIGAQSDRLADTGSGTLYHFARHASVHVPLASLWAWVTAATVLLALGGWRLRRG